MPNKDITMLGFLVDNDRKKVELAKPDQLEKFDELTHFKQSTPMNFYPIETAVRYQRVAAEIIYGSTDPEKFNKLGAWDYHLVSDTQLGKALNALYFKDVRSSAHAIPLVFKTIMKGMQIHVADVTDHEVDVIFDYNPFPPTYFQGMFSEILRVKFGRADQKVIAESLPGGGQLFKIIW